MNYYPFHIGDYASKTRHLSWDEDMAYRRLLDIYYTSESPLPLELRSVYRLVLASTDAQREAVKVILEEFFERTSDGWRNHRADEELACMLAKQQAARDKANKRWGSRMPQHMTSTEPGNASAMPQHGGEDAAASESDAKAMLPTPTPTPTPTPNTTTDVVTVGKGGAGGEAQPARKRATSPRCPDDVDPQVWADWLVLRKAKRAPVTETVVASAGDEARKAGLTLEAFLRVWCARGSQGLQADWLKPHERGGNGNGAEPPWLKEQRDRVAEFAGPAAMRRPGVTTAKVVKLEEVIDVNAKLLG